LCVGSKIDEDDEETKFNFSGLTYGVATVMCSAPAQASAAESRKMVNTINRRIAGLRQITASFVQESNLSFMDIKAISKGSMSYSVKDV
jgi:hypothetical protein